MNGLEGLRLEPGSRVGLTACSNGISVEKEGQIRRLCAVFEEMGLRPVMSPCFYERYGVFAGTGRERAEALTAFYRDEGIRAIFDLSGGDLANEILSFLDFSVIAGNPKPFFGYSDLTTILNSIYARTGGVSCLWQARNLIGPEGALQQKWFRESILGEGSSLFRPEVEFLRGNAMEGVLIGGNIRCFLKLAGTPFMPEFDGKILFLESWSGGAARMTALFSQLRQMGAFSRISGLILGTFSEMDEKGERPEAAEIALEAAAEREIPVARTRQVGHGKDSKALAVGRRYVLRA